MDAEQPAEPGIYTPEQVAHIFQVSPATVVRWADRGKLEGFKTPGNHWRFQRAVIVAAIENRMSNRDAS